MLPKAVLAAFSPASFFWVPEKVQDSWSQEEQHRAIVSLMSPWLSGEDGWGSRGAEHGCRCCPSRKPPVCCVCTTFPEVHMLVSAFWKKSRHARVLQTMQHCSLGCCTAARSACGRITNCDQGVSVRTAINTTADHPTAWQPLYCSVVWNYSDLVCDASFNFHLVIQHFLFQIFYYSIITQSQFLY